jgi:two-component system, LytTR family, response regulator
MLKICLIDDEQDARLLLREMLAELAPDCQIIGEANSKASAITLLKTAKPDAVFLDIDLKDGTGFEVLAALPHPQYPIVFATAFNQFAIKAFQVNALDYLLKPIERAELKRTVDKIRMHQPTPDFKNQISELLSNMQNRKIEKLVLHTAEGIHFLPITDILHLESSGNYTMVETIRGEKILVSSNLGQFEHLTEDYDATNSQPNPFFRIHQSHIIRVSTVRKLMKTTDGEYVILDNGAKVPIARRRREAFMSVMNNG